MDIPGQTEVRTKRHVLAQLVICKGCCCGRTDKGRPALPEERLRTIWKKERLARTVQLTISGCVGPCDVANVIQVITARGTEWFGRLERDAHYDALVEWARGCQAERSLLPRPVFLEAHRFEGYIAEPEKPHATPDESCCQNDGRTRTGP